MSQASQPSAVISARLIGRNGAALPEGARWPGREIRGFSASAGVFMALTHKPSAPRIQSAAIRARAGMEAADARRSTNSCHGTANSDTDADQFLHPLAPLAVEVSGEVGCGLLREKLVDGRVPHAI